MTKQTVELVYHDAGDIPTGRGDGSMSDTYLVYNFGATSWFPAWYDFLGRTWRSCATGDKIQITNWFDNPPIPKKKAWVKKEIQLQRAEFCPSPFYPNEYRVILPNGCRNILCTYEIEEEQP